MRDFTPEEKELIVNTPITRDCFEMGDYSDLPCDLESDVCTIPYLCEMWSSITHYLEYLRQEYNETKDKRYWKELIRLLPNSYKVVKL